MLSSAMLSGAHFSQVQCMSHLVGLNIIHFQRRWIRQHEQHKMQYKPYPCLIYILLFPNALLLSLDTVNFGQELSPIEVLIEKASCSQGLSHQLQLLAFFFHGLLLDFQNPFCSRGRIRETFQNYLTLKKKGCKLIPYTGELYVPKRHM